MTATTEATVSSADTSPFYMAGTEGTGEYKVLATSSFGSVGYRLLDSWGWDEVRIRLEPATPAHADKIAAVLTRKLGWKQPGDDKQARFSIVVRKGDGAITALETAFALIKRGRPLAYNPDLPDYVADLT